MEGEKLYFQSNSVYYNEFTFDQIVRVEIDRRGTMRLCLEEGYINSVTIESSLYSPRLARDCREHGIPFEYYKALCREPTVIQQKRDDDIDCFKRQCSGK